MTDWIPIEQEMPPKDTLVEVKIVSVYPAYWLELPDEFGRKWGIMREIINEEISHWRRVEE